MNAPSHDVAVAIPTKQFFVSMLTRDITLADAILDLIDNCLDGALRMAEGSEVNYSQHSVMIELEADHFRIEDNCGGIPREVAKNYAFKMGRESADGRDSETETIGMYGVGMKRAIFKMGRDASVQTLHGTDAFAVRIPAEWLDANDWESLPIVDQLDSDRRLRAPGTSILVKNLYPGVSTHFTNGSFRNELKTAIAEHFTVFLQSGLQISVNGEQVEPVKIEILVSEQPDGPAPFAFRTTIDDVQVSIAVGLNTSRGLPDGDEDDVPDFERHRSASIAGWTVFCNDRAVIVGDKSRLTGWGDGIPLYHYQFSIVTGIIEFRSKTAEKLPVTTTKRALDTSSEIWLQSLVKMKEGMRVWISYTNKWKNHPRSDQTVHWESAHPAALRQAITDVASREGAIRPDGRIEFNPQKRKVLPEPADAKPNSRRVIFSRPIEELRTVSRALFDISDEKPGIVGDKCFAMVLEEVRRAED